MAGGDKGRTMIVTVPSFHSLVGKKRIPQKLYPSHSAQPVCAKEGFSAGKSEFFWVNG